MDGLIDTRNEYIEHIQDIIGIAISKRINAIWSECFIANKGVKGFQNELYCVKKWNNNIVNDEYKKIVKNTKCKYLLNLIKIIIITTIKIKIYEYKDQFDNIKIKIPNPEDFVHKCFINVASFSWKNAYLFNKKNIKDAEYQNNLNIIEENIRIIIKKTFRDFIPFDEIFNQIEDNLSEDVKQFNECENRKHSKKISKDKKTKDDTKKDKYKKPKDAVVEEVDEIEYDDEENYIDEKENNDQEDDVEEDDVEDADVEEDDVEEDTENISNIQDIPKKFCKIEVNNINDITDKEVIIQGVCKEDDKENEIDVETPEKQLNETSDGEIETPEKQLNETSDGEIETPEKQLNEIRDEEIETHVKQVNEKQVNETSTLFNSNQYIETPVLKEEFTKDEKDLFDIYHKETKLRENNELDMDEKNIYIYDKKTNDKKEDYAKQEKDEKKYLKDFSEVQNKEIPEKKHDGNVKNIHITENSYSRNNKKLSFF